MKTTGTRLSRTRLCCDSLRCCALCGLDVRSNDWQTSRSVHILPGKKKKSPVSLFDITWEKKMINYRHTRHTAVHDSAWNPRTLTNSKKYDFQQLEKKTPHLIHTWVSACRVWYWCCFSLLHLLRGHLQTIMHRSRATKKGTRAGGRWASEFFRCQAWDHLLPRVSTVPERERSEPAHPSCFCTAAPSAGRTKMFEPAFLRASPSLWRLSFCTFWTF